jgi:hypothetical protein
MQFADPRAMATAYLILRHLYDGDIVEWPIPDDHPLRDIFVQLEAQGYVARWDRVWPLHDRYRLTEKGIAAIEAVYRPAGAESFFEDLRRRNLSPVDRRGYLQSQGLNPALWPLLHDPSTHWSTFFTHGARYHSYVWEDMQPPKRIRSSKTKKMSGGGGGRSVGGPKFPLHHEHAPLPIVHHVVDLDRQAQNADVGHVAPAAADYDVS